MYNTLVKIILMFIITYEVKKVATSQDFEARRRERLKMQHKKRERQRRIQRIILLIAVLFLGFLLIFNIVKCSKDKKERENAAMQATQIPYKEDTDAKFDPAIPDPQPGRNDYLDIISKSGETMHAYLTFNGGPSENVTPDILDVLRKYNVKATFFVNGKDIKDNPQVCRRAIEEGHLVLPLSKSGNADILYADKTTFIDEVEETYDLIVENSLENKKPVKIYRFLGGSYPNTAFGLDKQRYKDVLAENGYYYCDTNVSGDKLAQNYQNSKPNVNNLVIEFANRDESTSTANNLDILIKKLIDDGYTIGRLDEIEFINEIEFEDETPKPESNSKDDSTEKPSSTSKTTTAKPTTKPSATVKTTEKPTTKPTSTVKPAATANPVATEKPVTKTMAPNTIESE